jgi:hypothetical protein
LRFLGVVAGIMCACRAEQPDVASDSSTAAAEIRDSLVATNATGVQVWFTLPRAAAGDGRTCVERGLEIRRDGKRVPVPLLYTGTPPVFLNDTTMRAMLWTHCRPVEAYLVDLRSGRPVPERKGRKE